MRHHESNLSPHMGQDGEYWVLHCTNNFSLTICMHINHITLNDSACMHACIVMVSRFVNLLQIVIHA